MRGSHTRPVKGSKEEAQQKTLIVEIFHMEVQNHAVMYRRAGLDATAQALFNLAAVASGFKKDVTKKGRDNGFLKPVGDKSNCGSSHGATAAFPLMHIDLVINGLRTAYYTAMEGVGSSRKAYDVGDSSSKPVGYFLEMANFWYVHAVVVTIRVCAYTYVYVYTRVAARHTCKGSVFGLNIRGVCLCAYVCLRPCLG